MTTERDCSACSQAGGCASRRTEQKDLEEVSAAPFLLFAALLIILVSLVVRWLW